MSSINDMQICFFFAIDIGILCGEKRALNFPQQYQEVRKPHFPQQYQRLEDGCFPGVLRYA